MSNRTAEVQAFLDESKKAYFDEEYADAFNFAQDAFKIDRYDAEVYMYRAFSHLWYAVLTDDSLYEQKIIDDIDIVLNIGYEDRETEKYHELCEFCCRELLAYYLYLFDWTMDEFKNNRQQFGNLTDEEYNQSVDENLSTMCIPVEEAVEMLWEFAIFSKISDFSACSEKILTDSVNFIEEYRRITGRYAFYDTIDKFREILSSIEDGSYTPSIPVKYDLKEYIKSRKAFWIKHKTLLRGAAEERISLFEKELYTLEAQKKNAGLFAFNRKKELQAEIDAKTQTIIFLRSGMTAEVEAVNKLLEDLDNKMATAE